MRIAELGMAGCLALAAGCASLPSGGNEESCTSVTTDAASLPTVEPATPLRFEPSGIAVVGVGESARAYLVNDKDNALVYYAVDAASLDGTSRQLERVVLDGEMGAKGAPKWEDAEPCRGRICGRTLASCRHGGCFWMVGSGSYEQPPHLVLIDPATGTYAERTAPFSRAFERMKRVLMRGQAPGERWAQIEALAQARDGRFLVGVRQAGSDYKHFNYHRVVFEVIPRGKAWRVKRLWEEPAVTPDECGYKRVTAISGLTWSQGHQGYLATFSMETAPDASGVWAELAVLKRGRDGHLSVEVLNTYDNKAEGVAVHGDTVIVIFDSDQDRKGGPRPLSFPIESHQDYYHSDKR